MHQSYTIARVNIQIHCGDASLGRRIAGAFEEFFFMTKEDSLPEKHDISMRFQNHSIPFVVSETARELGLTFRPPRGWVGHIEWEDLASS